MLVGNSVARQRPRIGEILIEWGKITSEQLQAALQWQRQTHVYLGCILVEMGLVTEDNIRAALAEQATYDWAMRRAA